ncbi:beta-lactamase family protein [Planctomycetota bacterium]|nr:beta-lactamase family protein [Planctomycetota bacterium]
MIAEEQRSHIIGSLQNMMQENRIPGLVLGIYDYKRSTIINLGKRHINQADPIQIDDNFHLGSCCKPITATLFAVLVEQNYFTWDAPLFRYLSSLVPDISSDYKNITLRQLFTCTAGLPPFIDDSEFDSLPPITGSSREQRLAFTQSILSKPAHTKPSNFTYSNASYAILGSLAEQKLNRDWSELLYEYIFKPLNITAGLGLPSLNNSNQPHGHCYKNQTNLHMNDIAKLPRDTEVVPYPNGQQYIHPILQPAGDLHLSIPAYIKFLQMHLNSFMNTYTLISPTLIRHMHTQAAEHSFGWTNSVIDKIPVSQVNGWGGAFYTHTILSVGQNTGLTLATNTGHIQAVVACQKMIHSLFQTLDYAKEQLVY